MSAPVQSRASLSATASANSARAGYNGVVAVSWTRNNRLCSSAVCPRRHAIAQQTPIPRQTIEPFSERGARSQRVLDEVERATRQRLGEMDAESFIACEGRGETPRRLGRSLGDANARIHEPRPAEEPANRRRVYAAAFHPCDEVWGYPTLYGGRDDRAPVPPARTFRPFRLASSALPSSARLIELVRKTLTQPDGDAFGIEIPFAPIFPVETANACSQPCSYLVVCRRA